MQYLALLLALLSGPITGPVAEGREFILFTDNGVLRILAENEDGTGHLESGFERIVTQASEFSVWSQNKYITINYRFDATINMFPARSCTMNFSQDDKGEIKVEVDFRGGQSITTAKKFKCLKDAINDRQGRMFMHTLFSKLDLPVVTVQQLRVILMDEHEPITDAVRAEVNTAIEGVNTQDAHARRASEKVLRRHFSVLREVLRGRSLNPMQRVIVESATELPYIDVPPVLKNNIIVALKSEKAQW